MASNAPGQCCMQTNFHDGTPAGKYETVFGLDTYVIGENDAKVVVLLTDIYGHKLNNTVLLADQFASAGYSVYVPDILKNDPVVEGTSLPDWLKVHPKEVTTPLVESFMSELRKKVGGSAYIGVVGYCYGAKYAVQQIAEAGHANAAAIAHPSFVEMEDIAAIKKPLLVSAAQTDPIFTDELRHQTEAKLIEIGARFQIDLFSGVSHGFACRGDMSDPVTKYAAEKALSDQLCWFSCVGQ